MVSRPSSPRGLLPSPSLCQGLIDLLVCYQTQSWTDVGFRHDLLPQRHWWFLKRRKKIHGELSRLCVPAQVDCEMTSMLRPFSLPRFSLPTCLLVGFQGRDGCPPARREQHFQHLTLLCLLPYLDSYGPANINGLLSPYF